MNRIMSRDVLSALSMLVALAAFTPANAQIVSVSSYTPIYQGVSEATATIQGSAGTSQAYVVQVNLDAPGISFTSTGLAPGGSPAGTVETTSQTTSQFLQATATQVAINTVPFNTCCSTTTAQPETLDGLAVSNGTLVAPDQLGTADLLLTANNQASMVAGGSANLNGVYNAAGGFAFVLQNGTNVVNASTATASTTPDPRTAVGLSQNDQYMYLVAVDGRQTGYSEGVTLSELSNLMHDIGSYNAIEMDGGGSTAVAIEGANGSADVLNSPSGGAERYDGDNLGIYAESLTPVPVPPSVALFGSALLGMTALRRRRFAG
jgi:hypothetical protein